MKNTRIITAAVAGIFTLPAVYAADITWDTAPGTVGAGDSVVTGGAGTWDTTNGNWTVDTGANNIAWVNGSDLALFTDTGDTVTLGSAITAQGLKFIVAGYTVEGSGNTITLAGNGDDRIGDSPGPSFSLDNGGTVTINADIDNAGNLLTIVGDRSGGRNIVISGAISGSGGLHTYESVSATLSGANTYTGQTKVNAATTSGSTLSISSFNSVNDPDGAGPLEGTPSFASSSLGAPTTEQNGTVEIGNTGKQASCTLIYTGPGETTDRIMSFRMNGSPRNYEIRNNGSGLLKFTSKPTKAGASTGIIVLGGSADGEFELGLPDSPLYNLIRKDDAGTWTLGGSSVSQGTTVTNGTLVITGTVEATSGPQTSGVVAVNGGGSTLTVDGMLKFVSATVSGGTLDGSGTLSFDIDGTTSDLVTMSSGTTDISGMSVEIVPGGGSGLTESEYILIDATGGGTLTGTFTGFAGTPPAGYSLNYDTPNQVKLVSGVTDPFDTWAALGTGVTFEGDANGDGVIDGLAFLLGVPDPDDDANGSLPVATEDGSGGLVLTFNCLPVADRGAAELRVAHSNDLGSSDPWTPTVDEVPDANDAVPDSGTTFVVTPGSPLNSVVATIDAAEAAAGKLFGRLEGTQ